MTLLEINQLNKTFVKGRDVTHVLNNIDLHVKNGEFITIIGPSGCGKSTLLKAMAGLDIEYSGEIKLDGERVTGASIRQGVIFQEPRLFPWLTVERNIAASLPLTNSEVKQNVDKLIKLVRLEGFEKAYPKELSGGMAQRVSIARALLRKPKILLLDEPFGALDAFTRSHMQDALLDIWKEEKTSMVFVTHDIDEAIYLGNKVIIMSARPGTIQNIINIDLPFPRKKSTKSFQEFRQLVLREFEKVEELELIDSAGI
ncbi:MULTISPECIES: ABC transporter ATP-binding protein [Neobacillus]|uniref:ABC transporter ATP-binding protein n=1 Tax=Neobacillus rhizophilus TaxID=2833579 RepID=A0A942U7F5_9BACI|nr:MULTISPECIES: ABC transporter ATP-binding protein [Neobacillus]MBS4214820.1 ABC transporter ATP-binding protein [Neobacillus rhizophilus]